MRLSRIVILTIVFLLPALLFAQNKNYSKKEVDAMLDMLDSAVVHKKEYQKQRQQRIDSIEHVVNTCPPDLYVDNCKELYSALSDYDGRRSLKALERIEKTNAYQEDKVLQTWVLLNQSRVYAIMGLYHNANGITNRIDPKELTPEEQQHYYIICLRNIENISDYLSDISVVQDEERNRIAYYDKIIELGLDEVMTHLMLASKEIELHRPEGALLALARIKTPQEGRRLIYQLLALASIYEQKGNQQNQIYYLAQAAIENIQSGTTEYIALARLVHVLYGYEEGEYVNRAYVYLMCMMEDANAYPSRSLSLDVSRYFPIINRAYSSHHADEEKADQTKRQSLLVTFALLALTLAVSFYLGWHQNNARKEKKRADQLQKALDQATIADRVKTVFIQNMRHEIRTPLNAIMGFAQLMSNDLSQEERALYQNYIKESNDHLLATLDDIIDVSNMEVGTFNFHFENFDIDTLCYERMETAREQLVAGVAFNYQPLQKGLQLYSDQKRVGQVLHNLLSNACKNTTEGSITLSVAHQIANDSIEFVVADTGPGIPPEKTDVIFEHFEKLDHYAPGLGLGLYVCRLIARALGGDIYLDTSYKKGARFVFTVPNKDIE